MKRIKRTVKYFIPENCIGLPWMSYELLRLFKRSFGIRYSLSQLKQYQNRYNGETCIIVGNGPSLKNTDTALLKGEYTFSMNRAYIGWEQMGFFSNLLCLY